MKTWAKDGHRDFSQEDLKRANRCMKTCSPSLSLRPRQIQTAQNVALPWQYVTTLQNTASSVATIACPSRITLGAYLCNILYRENELLKKTTLMIFGAVLLIVV